MLIYVFMAFSLLTFVTVSSLESDFVCVYIYAICFQLNVGKETEMINFLSGGGLLGARSAALLASQSRSIVNMPTWEYHIRFSMKDGNKIPCKDVLDRFKRLNNGIWIRTHPGRYRKRYQKNEPWLSSSVQHYTTTPMETQMLEKMVNNFWLRPKYYPDDLYAPYNVRHGLKTPRVNDRGEMVRERKKILLEDTIADQHFYDR